MSSDRIRFMSKTLLQGSDYDSKAEVGYERQPRRETCQKTRDGIIAARCALLRSAI